MNNHRTETPYRTVTPRLAITYVFEASCYIPHELTKPWADYTLDDQEKFAQHGPIPCDGEFRPGRWCEGCDFGEVSPMRESPYA